MSSNKDNPNRISRRSVLQSSAVVTGMGGLISTVSANENSNNADQAFDAAIQVFEATGSTEKFKKVLENNGLNVVSKEKTFQVPVNSTDDESSDGISTQALDTRDFNLFISLAKYANNSGVQVFSHWTHEVDYSLPDNDSGEKPDDIAGFGFAEDDYILDDWQSDEYTDRKEYNASGIAFEYCDACCGLYEDATGTCTPQGEEFEIDGWCQIQLSPKTSGTKDHIYFDYHHLFSNISVDGIGISSGGISVTVSEEQKSWHRDARMNPNDVDDGDVSTKEPY